MTTKQMKTEASPIKKVYSYCITWLGQVDRRTYSEITLQIVLLLTGWHCPLTAWAICSALSKLCSSIPSSSSAVFPWKIICVCGDWLVFPLTSNPFVVARFPFLSSLCENCLLTVLLCAISPLSKWHMTRHPQLLQPTSSDSMLLCLPFCASDW